MKSTTKQDLQNPNIPKLMYDKEKMKLVKWDGHFRPNWCFHHTVKQQILKRRPELYKYLKLIYFPPLYECIKTLNGGEGNPHLEADNKHSKYFERWGIPLSKVIYLDNVKTN